MRILFALLILSLPAPAFAFAPVTERAAFLSLVEGKRLTGSGIGLEVTREGAITGRAFGFRVTGGWTWEGGLFCRTLNSAIRSFPLNCQTVAVQGDVIRFQADRGTGDIADLQIR